MQLVRGIHNIWPKDQLLSVLTFGIWIGKRQYIQ